MIVVVCLDEQRGMLFNQRRQTKDRKVIEDLHQMIDFPIYIDPFSQDLFEMDKVYVSSEFLEIVHEGDICFVENQNLSTRLDQIEAMIIYHWNRKYPTDFCLDIDYSSCFEQVSVSEFIGNSHEKITREIWRKK